MVRRVFRENPGWGGGKAPLADALRLSGHEEEALETWRDEYEIRGEPAVVAALQRGFREGGYETAYRRGAEAIAARFAEGGRVLPIDAAAFYMAAELPEQAIDWLERAVAIHDQNVPFIGALPTFEPLHDDPRFQTLLERLDLPLLRRSSP